MKRGCCPRTSFACEAASTEVCPERGAYVSIGAWLSYRYVAVVLKTPLILPVHSSQREIDFSQGFRDPRNDSFNERVVYGYMDSRDQPRRRGYQTRVLCPDSPNRQ